MQWLMERLGHLPDHPVVTALIFVVGAGSMLVFMFATL